MKKLILILAVTVISCKKDKDVIPVKIGNVSFYNGNIREKMIVTINGQVIGKTAIKPLGYVPDCQTDWAVKYSDRTGFYIYEAISIDSLTTTSGSFEIKANECVIILLNI